MVDWRGRKKSDNVVDMRGQRAPMGMGRRSVRTGGGIGVVGIVIVIIMFFMGADPSQLLGVLLGGGDPGGARIEDHAPEQPRSGAPAADDEGRDFMEVVLQDTEETWGRLFEDAGSRYPQPKLVLYEDAVESACGMGSAAAGPFYCPSDQQLYLDLSFFNELSKMGAPGDFAQAYVIGHEVGHHVQNVLGVLERSHHAKARLSEADGNAVQVLVELQADCYAGVWAHHAESQRDLLESGDVEEGLEAATAIGDDTLMKRAGRPVNAESFTHGSAAQRVKWFRTGFESGNVGSCDTFAAAGVKLR
jgi:predicted metalloprotease